MSACNHRGPGRDGDCPLPADHSGPHLSWYQDRVHDSPFWFVCIYEVDPEQERLGRRGDLVGGCFSEEPVGGGTIAAVAAEHGYPLVEVAR